ncbi:MAG: adenosylcobinamide-GDP ribazoletransferase [Hyphomicrobiales bacterium]
MNDHLPSRMPDHLRQWWADLKHSLGFLTRLPVGHGAPAPRPAAMRAYPLAGAVVGLCGGVLYLCADAANLPAGLAALLAVAAMVAVTGALHEDGVADTADGFGGGWDRERKLEIMRDSRIGSFGVIALVLVLGIKVFAIAALAGRSGDPAMPLYALIGSAALSRAMSVWLLRLLPPARADGLSADAGRPSPRVVTQALIAGAVVAGLPVLLTLGLMALLIAAAAAALGLWLVKRLAQKQIQGQTGDVAGACQQVSECLYLMALTTVL